jgi:hypothetical protein
MRVLVAAIVAALSTGTPPPAGDLAVTIDAHRVARSCAVASTATIVAFDAAASRVVSYRFVRSDGSASPVGHVILGGDGAVAQSVRDEWKPRGSSPWVAFEVIAPHRLRSTRAAIASTCAHGAIAKAS